MAALIRVLSLAAVLLVCAGLGATQLSRPRAVTIIADGETRHVTSLAESVGDMLIESGITLGDRDRTSPPLRASAPDGAVISVTRISYRKVEELAPVEAATTVLAARNLPAGYTKIIQHGTDGLVKRVVAIWERDGRVARREVLRERVIVRGRPLVVLRGVRGEPVRGGDWRHPRRMVATGYAAGFCGGSASGRTATGAKAQRGVVAVDSRSIPLGARLYIPGYGFALAADRGGVIKGNRIDLCFDTHREAKQFGRQAVDVYLLR